MKSNLKSLKYLEIKDLKNATLIILKSIKEFANLIDELNPKFVYYKEPEIAMNDSDLNRYKGNSKDEWKEYYTDNNCDNINDNLVDSYEYYEEQYDIKEFSQFYLYDNGVMYVLNGWNYRSLYDMLDGDENGFLIGDFYYLSKQMGTKIFSDFVNMKFKGYTNISVYQDSKNKGYVGKFNEFFSELLDIKNYRFAYKYSESDLIDLYQLKRKSEADLYNLAEEFGYKDFKEFSQAIYNGFLYVDDYKKAKAMGFSNYSPYLLAVENDISNNDEFKHRLEEDNLDFINMSHYTMFKKLGYKLPKRIDKEVHQVWS